MRLLDRFGDFDLIQTPPAGFEQNWKSEKAGDLDCKVKLNAQLNGIYEMRIEHMGWRVNKRIAIIQN